jgi:DNA-binding CsgD family transcriptional regulator
MKKAKLGRETDASAEEEAVAYLVVINLPEWHAAILRSEQLVGRGAEAAIRVPNRFRSVSRRHASIWADDRDRLWIRDLGSRLGTAVNGVPLIPEQPIQMVIGDRILLGVVELEVLASPRLFAEMVELELLDVEETGKSTPPRSPAASGPRQLLSELTPAELEIVVCMCRGYTGLDLIAQQLYRSPHTVRTQPVSIFRKMGVHSRDELVGSLRLAAAGKEGDASRQADSHSNGDDK